MCDETGRTLESDRVQVVKDNLLILLLNLFLLPKNDIALPLNRRLFELGVLENVGENVDGLGHVLVERLGVVDGLLAGSVGVQVRTEVFHFELQLRLGSRLGSLERKVLFCVSDRPRPPSLPTHLEEVGGPAGVRRICPGTSVDPEADGRGRRSRDGLCGDTQAVRERGRPGDGVCGDGDWVHGSKVPRQRLFFLKISDQ